MRLLGADFIGLDSSSQALQTYAGALTLELTPECMLKF